MEQNQQQNYLYLDPNTFTIETYLSLVGELNQATSNTFDQETFRQADQLLTQFSKSHQAWSVSIQVLTLENLSDKEYFHAANILKNKMIYDFASLKHKDFNISFQIRDNLLIILKKMVNESKPPFLINCLCTGIAILSMHLNEFWSDIVENLSLELSSSFEQATSLFMIMKYMASDCDNDSIVIEDSIRSNYFKFLDTISGQVFYQVFNLWAQKINTYVITEDNSEYYKLQKLKAQLLDAFYNWIKLRLPDDIISNMTTNYPDLLELVFSELENKDQNLENATNCVIELIVISRKKPDKFGKIQELVISKVTHLIGRVDKVVQEKDESVGEQLTDIFVELGQTYLQKIIETGDLGIPEILLKLMTIPEIANRRQVPFWKSLFKQISKIQDLDIKRSKLITLEPILLRLLDQLTKLMKADDDMFEDFNYESEFEEQFDDFNLLRQDFGKLLSTISKCCGPQVVYQVLEEKLKNHIQNVQDNNKNITEWASIECLITCICDVAPSFTSNEIGTLSQTIQLIFQLPNSYVALRRAGANLFASLSESMKQHGINAQQDVKKFVDYVIEGLDNKYAMPACSKAFETLCSDNALSLSLYTAELIEKSNLLRLSFLALPYPATSWGAKQQYFLILDGLAALIEKQEDNQQCEQCLKRVIDSLAIPLKEKINNLQVLFDKEGRKLNVDEINEGIITSIQSFLELIGDFIKGCKGLKEKEQNPFEVIFKDIWANLIQFNIEYFTHIDDIVEYTIRLVKHCMRILGRKFDNYLITFLQLVIKAYEQNPIPGFIYSIEFCLVEYHNYREFEQIFLEAFNLISQKTTQIFQTLSDIEKNPDVAFDFFGMCIRYLKLTKELVFRSSQLENLIRVWITGIGIEHQDAVETHTEFFMTLIKVITQDLQTVHDVSNEQEIVAQGIQQNEVLVWNFFLSNGQSIVDKYLQVILRAPNKSVVEKFEDVLVEIAMKFPLEYKRQWFTNSFSKIGGDVLTEEEKQTHLNEIITDNPKHSYVVENFEIVAKRARNSYNRGN